MLQEDCKEYTDLGNCHTASKIMNRLTTLYDVIERTAVYVIFDCCALRSKANLSHAYPAPTYSGTIHSNIMRVFYVSHLPSQTTAVLFSEWCSPKN